MSNIVTQLKDQDQDFEWYPTTDVMIETVATDIKRELLEEQMYLPSSSVSVLDIGAGDGHRGC